MRRQTARRRARASGARWASASDGTTRHLPNRLASRYCSSHCSPANVRTAWVCGMRGAPRGASTHCPVIPKRITSQTGDSNRPARRFRRRLATDSRSSPAELPPAAVLKLPAASCGESSKCKEVKVDDFHVARLPRCKLWGMRSQCTFRDRTTPRVGHYSHTPHRYEDPTRGVFNRFEGVVRRSACRRRGVRRSRSSSPRRRETGRRRDPRPRR